MSTFKKVVIFGSTMLGYAVAIFAFNQYYLLHLHSLEYYYTLEGMKITAGLCAIESIIGGILANWFGKHFFGVTDNGDENRSENKEP